MIFLDITFEMLGILESLDHKIDYDDKDIIIIEIKGKNKEFNILGIDEPINKEQGNLKYTDFDFQVQIDKYFKNKFEIEIKEEGMTKEEDIENGIYSLLFPIQLYEI
jgi:hypothetical protein